MSLTPSHKALFQTLRDHPPREIAREDRRSAAVLIPIITDKNGNFDRLVYTLRSRHLKKHPSQISFPGGMIESGESPWQAALREAHEEIGLLPESVTPMGRIDDVTSPQGFHVQCYPGVCAEFEAKLNEQEVERLVIVDREELFDKSLHETQQMGNRNLHFFHFREGTVWGVTGRITYDLRQILSKHR